MPGVNWEDIIVSFSQCEGEEPPTLTSIHSIADVKTDKEDLQIVAIKTTLNNFDWTGLHMLHKYKDDPLVEGDYYLYVLDTCKVDKDFWRKVLHLIPDGDSDPLRETLMMTTKPHSSIAIFGKGVIQNYSTNFGSLILIVEILSLMCLCDRNETHFEDFRTYIGDV